MILRTFILFLASICTLGAADFTITISVPDASAAEVLSTVSAWRQRQLQEDGVTLKHPTNAALGQSILADALRRILRQQCEFDPATCPASIKTHLDTKNAAESGIDSQLGEVVKEQ